MIFMRVFIKMIRKEEEYLYKIRNIFECYVQNREYTEEIDTDFYEFMVYHKLEMVYAAVAGKENLKFEKEIINRQKKIKKIFNIYSEELKRILSKFEEYDIKYIILKGYSNVNCLYRNLTDRYFNDLDILIQECDISKIEVIMQEEGYVYGKRRNGVIIPATRMAILFQKRFTHEIYNMAKNIQGEFINFDFNYLFSWRCLNKEVLNCIHFEQVEEHSMYMEKRNSNFCFFNANMQFVHLCCHFTNEVTCFALDAEYVGDDPCELRLNRLLDIILLFGKIDIGEVMRITNILECKKQIDFALYIVRFVMGEEYFNNAIRWDIQDGNYNYYILKDGSKKLWPISLATRLFNLEERKNVFEQHRLG